MKVNPRKMFRILVFLTLYLLFAAVACAEAEAAPQAGTNVIAGFEPLGDAGEITVQ